MLFDFCLIILFLLEMDIIIIMIVIIEKCICKENENKKEIL